MGKQKGMIHRTLFRKLRMERYFSSGLVLSIDLVLSVCASAGMLLLMRLLLRLGSFDSHFAWMWIGAAAVASLIVFIGLRSYRSIIRYATLREVGKLCMVVFCKEAVMGLIFLLISHGITLSIPLAGMLLIDFALTVCFLILVRVAMVMVYDTIRRRLNASIRIPSIVIYGNNDKSVAALMRLRASTHYRVAGFLTHGRHLHGHTLSGLPVWYFEHERDIAWLRDRHGISGVLFAYPADAREEQERLIRWCRAADIKILLAPGIDEMGSGDIKPGDVRRIRIEDLLGRAEIKISMDEIIANFRDKTVMVTGAAGSIGSELCRQLARFGIRRLIMYDNAETPLHNVRLEFEEKFPTLDFVPIIGDVRHKERLDFVMRTHHPQIVFHAAAYKHVPLMEENPCEAVLANVVGSRNVADKCIEYDVEKMIMISTDKAVNPTNIMGCTKRLAEIYVQSLGLAVVSGSHEGRTRFITTRFGNVLGSNGSVIPRFREQIEKGGPVTVTHPEIRRFFMTIPEACRLVMEAATISNGNRICVFDMGEAVKIADLARQMIELAGYRPDEDIKIEYTGLRPGEKLYEEVLASKEGTEPTSHDRIRIARVREYDYDGVTEVVDKLQVLAQSVQIPAMVRLMKQTVPEFISKNSEFEAFDHPEGK